MHVNARTSPSPFFFRPMHSWGSLHCTSRRRGITFPPSNPCLKRKPTSTSSTYIHRCMFICVFVFRDNTPALETLLEKKANIDLPYVQRWAHVFMLYKLFPVDTPDLAIRP